MENVCSWRRYADDLDEDGVERPRLPRAVMDRRSRPGPEPTSLEAVGDQWRYALIVVEAGDDDDDDECQHQDNTCCIPTSRMEDSAWTSPE